MNIKSTGEDAYFAASNSRSGFFSYYPQCFDTERIGHVFAIKGGPGTGKSYFMRAVSEHARRGGWQAEYVYCSSDPDSLDGVILTRDGNGVAILDATAPHVYEPTTPGVREEIIDLGAFWNRDALTAHADEIQAMNTEKREAYRQAYRYLAAYGEMSENRDELVAPYIRTDAMESFAEKLFWNVPRGRGFREQPALMRSIGMQGQVGFDTYFARAEKIFLVEDCRGSAQYFMRILYQLAQKRRLRLRVSHDPILPERIDGLYLCDCDWVFAVGRTEECAYPYKRVGTRRFVDTTAMKSVRAPLNHAEQMCRAMLGGARDALARVCEVHFKIEEIYAASMDFAAKEAFTKSFCETHFPLQCEE